uniref:Putative reverse transcriptase, RNA-dependent DNA polymerase n=1 Tax=Tanacetum cinerariifolium TaxID=118510 RepID=A0A6L2JFP3_TANCI|nr:putative reverse transcriptase, RNA-dependent DNA polymerase [Tanacetum cinerariifolium]
MIQQVQNSCQFHGLPGDDANKHLDKFLHVTQSIKVNGVTDDALRLYLFLHSLTHHATAWFDRLPTNSINTFEQMAKMFLGKYFPPSMVKKLRNEITNFRQRLDESLFEAWERYKLSTDRCHNHNMLPITQIDTFYNRLTLRHRDTINAAAGETFMKRRLEECYDLIENMTAHHNDWDTSAQRTLAKPRTYMLREPIKVILINLKGNNQRRNQFFQGASHGRTPPSAYQAPAYQALVYQAPVHQPQIPQLQVVTTNKFTNFMKANDAILKNMQPDFPFLMFCGFIQVYNVLDPQKSLILLLYVLGNPQQKDYKEKGVIDSGCSRHMRGNKCYLTEYEDYVGGFVSFGDGKGRISRKGKIKTGTLDFNDVYFCKALKLLDESQVLLRVPRKDNIYSVDLKSVVPTRGIKREFIIPSTPQHNGVAERKNKTLIEATRTMLVDSKLPITFWAEAVNTACYVLKRALVIKPHNKAPYELICGRPPLIDFMKPFGCPVTILNTRDYLGKFDEKADERFFVGYSVVSKPMRVFNKRTKIVEETLNIRFLENTPNVKGNRPDWLFDIDSLTISMNYVPVAAGFQTNGPKDSAVDAGKKATKVDASQVSNNGGQDTRKVDMNNVVPSYTIPDAPLTKFLKDHPKDQVFRNKKDERGIVIKNKARLVAQGHTQEEVYQMDVKSAFLYEKIQEEVYVCQPSGFEDPDFLDKVYKVEKALYRLHQAPRAWFQVTPKTSHLHAMKRIFRYLKGQPKLGLWYPKDSPFDLEAYSGSDYAKASLDRKSTTRGCQFLGKRLISWQCKKQTIVANSTTEAEYVAAASCYGQVLWIQNQMLDYGFNLMNTKIYIDYGSIICIVKNLVFHCKTKHIKIRHHFIRDLYEKKLIQAYLISKRGSQFRMMISKNGRCFMDILVVKTGISSLNTSGRKTGSSSRPRYQVTILGSAEAQTRFEAASKPSNDPPLLRGHTLGSGEDIIKLQGIDGILYKII